MLQYWLISNKINLSKTSGNRSYLSTTTYLKLNFFLSFWSTSNLVFFLNICHRIFLCIIYFSLHKNIIEKVSNSTGCAKVVIKTKIFSVSRKNKSQNSFIILFEKNVVLYLIMKMNLWFLLQIKRPQPKKSWVCWIT